METEILLIEDEEKIARVLQLELNHEGYQVKLAETGRKGLELALAKEWDLILLDVMLPELNGLEVLRRIRQSNQLVPVILLTARDSIPDKVSGLDQGANDYITKPFAIEELLARIRNLLRIFQHMDTSNEEIETHIGDLKINVSNREVVKDKQQVDLTHKEFELLYFMSKNKGKVVTREQIMNEVWGYDYIGDTNIVDVYIRHLRLKIDKNAKTPLIHTSRGVGYCLKEVGV